MKRSGPMLAALAAVAALAGAAPAGAGDVKPDRLVVVAKETTVHELPAAGQPVVIRIMRGRALLGWRRLGPGRHEDWGPFVAKQTVEIPAGEAWIDVGVTRSGGKSCWVRAADVALDYRAEVVAEVIDPCALAAVRASGPLAKSQEDAALRLIKRRLAGELGALSSEIAAAVAGKPRAERRRIYAKSLAACIAG